MPYKIALQAKLNLLVIVCYSFYLVFCQFAWKIVHSSSLPQPADCLQLQNYSTKAKTILYNYTNNRKIIQNLVFVCFSLSFQIFCQRTFHFLQTLGHTLGIVQSTFERSMGMVILIISFGILHTYLIVGIGGDVVQVEECNACLIHNFTIPLSMLPCRPYRHFFNRVLP